MICDVWRVTCDVWRVMCDVRCYRLSLTRFSTGNVAAVYILSDCAPPPSSSQAETPLDYTKTVGFSGANTTLFIVLSLAGAAGCLVFLTLRQPDAKLVAHWHFTLLHLSRASHDTSNASPPRLPPDTALRSTLWTARCARKWWEW